jgi:hypothetical protein
MRRVKRFAQAMKRETEAQISQQRNASPPDVWLIRFLEGRLEAFDLLERYLDRLEEEDVLVHGSASAFSPQG